MKTKLEVGFFGLGRMGYNMCSRILKSDLINLHVFDRNEEKRKEMIEKGATSHATGEDLLKGLWSKRKIVWIMLPAGNITQEYVELCFKHLNKGDIVIDGGNSNFKDTLQRVGTAKEKGIHFVDVGVSGGIIAADTGYPMMAGCDEEIYEVIKPLLDSFGYENGYGRVGPSGSGHYTKMIHNAVEYGMMQAISEGFDLLENGRFKEQLDLKHIAGIWNNGCVVSSFLMEMVSRALKKEGGLEGIAPYVEDNGEGRWSSIEAMEYSVPFVVNTYALHARYISRDKNSYTFRMLSAMRNEFGGHAIKKK